MLKIFKSIKTAVIKLTLRTVMAVGNNRGDGALDHAMSILITVVVGALLLAGLYALFGDTIIPVLTRKIQELFDYTG